MADRIKVSSIAEYQRTLLTNLRGSKSIDRSYTGLIPACSQKTREQQHLNSVSRPRLSHVVADKIPDTHKWTVFVTSAATPPPKEGDVENMDYIPGGADDLGYMIKRISFKLYDTYPNANRSSYLCTSVNDVHLG